MHPWPWSLPTLNPYIPQRSILPARQTQKHHKPQNQQPHSNVLLHHDLQKGNHDHLKHREQVTQSYDRPDVKEFRFWHGASKMTGEEQEEDEEEREGNYGTPEADGRVDKGDGDEDDGDAGVGGDLFGAAAPRDSQAVADCRHDGAAAGGWHACAGD